LSFVLDASLTLAWCFRDEATTHTNAALEALRASPAVVPSIWFYEVTNALVTGIRRDRLSEREAMRFLESLDDLPIDVVPLPTRPRSAFQEIRALASREQLTAYDAAYLALALELGLPLGTLDGAGRRQGLKHAAERCGVELFVAH
jgi:predicted nucleic acid-binding protein